MTFHFNLNINMSIFVVYMYASFAFKFTDLMLVMAHIHEDEANILENKNFFATVTLPPKFEFDNDLEKNGGDQYLVKINEEEEPNTAPTA